MTEQPEKSPSFTHTQAKPRGIAVHTGGGKNGLFKTTANMFTQELGKKRSSVRQRAITEREERTSRCGHLITVRFILHIRTSQLRNLHAQKNKKKTVDSSIL